MKRRDFLASLGLTIIGPRLVRYVRPTLTAPSAQAARLGETVETGEVLVYLHDWYRVDWYADPQGLAQAEAARALRAKVEEVCASLGEEDARIARALADHFWRVTWTHSPRGTMYTTSTLFGWPSWRPSPDGAMA